MTYKVVNQINNIVSKLVSEKEELKREVFILKNKKVEENEVDATGLIEAVSKITAEEVVKASEYYRTLEYDENGINNTYDKWLEDVSIRYFTGNNNLLKSISYNDLILLISKYMKVHYDSQVNDLKMEYVRSHKEDEDE